MARKRFVTSEISTDRKIAKLAEKNPTAAALWPWFITAFDDWGRMNADPIEVKLTVFPAFPYTSDDIETFIKLYHEFGIAYHYEVDGKPYLAVNPDTWLKYQTYIRKDKLEKQNSKIPEPKNAPWVAKNNTVDDLATKNVAKQQSATINVLSPSPSPSPSPSKEIYTCAPVVNCVKEYSEYIPSENPSETLSKPYTKPGTGTGTGTGSVTECMHGAETAPYQPTAPPIITLTLNDKTEYPVTEEQVEEWTKLYPAVDVMQELRKMKGWLDANPSRRKTKKGILRFINSWLSKEQDRGSYKARASPPAFKNYDDEEDFLKG